MPIRNMWHWEKTPNGSGNGTESSLSKRLPLPQSNHSDEENQEHPGLYITARDSFLTKPGTVEQHILQIRLLSRAIILALCSVSILSPGCYSFKGFSIGQELSTFGVSDFRNTAVNAPPTIQQTFQERLKEKVIRESRLKFDDVNPDLTFSGTITRFSVTAVAPERDATTSANRLDIAVNVTYENARNEKNRWTQTFSHFADFATTDNLLDIQDQLITIIFDQVIEDIFNKAFADW